MKETISSRQLASNYRRWADSAGPHSKLGRFYFQRAVAYNKIAAKAELFEYIHKGEKKIIPDERRPYIDDQRVRELLIEAGYTQLGIHCWWCIDDHFKKTKNGPQTAVQFRLEEKNRYGYQPGWHGVDELPTLMEKNPPDFEEGRDILRARFLKSLDDLQELKKQLDQAGKHWIHLGTWTYDAENDTIRFLLNPIQQERYEYGWYTLDELRLWLDDKGPVTERRKR